MIFRRLLLVFALISSFLCCKAAEVHPPAGNPPSYVWEQAGDTWTIVPNPAASVLQTDPGMGPWVLTLRYLAGQEPVPGELNWYAPPGETGEDPPLRVFDFYPKPGQSAPLIFHGGRWGALPEKITLQVQDFEILALELEFQGDDSKVPLEADLGTMMYYPPSRWRHGDYEIFSFNLHQEIFYLITKDFSVQSRFLKRLAFFTEKPGFAGTLARDETIEDLRDWFAHDYRARDVAAFFELARLENFPLNENEVLLRDMLLAHGVIRSEGGRFTEGKGALIGLSAESRDRLPVYFVHETIHGLEFIMPELQTLFLEFFDSLSSRERNFMRDALIYRGYNVIENKKLLVSEAAAYLLQQPPEEADRYFREYVRQWYQAYHRILPGPESKGADGAGEEGGEAEEAGAGADPASSAPETAADRDVPEEPAGTEEPVPAVPPPVFRDEVLSFLDGNPGIFGRRSAALQKRFHELTGLRAATFYDLLPKDRRL
ncbi:MAG: hypothetical protein LBD31_04115 [Treponema sp.]|jgi:hypothetical protein|nr:hypothetical protein [Treponema sp.]